MKHLIKAVKLARVRKGLTPVEVAKKAEINEKYYYALERGDNDPSIRTLAKIAAAIDCPLWQIIKEAEELEKEGE